MPDMAGDIMSFCTCHFSSSPLIGQFYGENRWIKTVSRTFIRHFIGNVNYLAWPDPSPLMSNIAKTYHKKVHTKVWKKLHDLFVDKKEYINSIIDAATKERQIIKAQRALDQFKTVMI